MGHVVFVGDGALYEGDQRLGDARYQVDITAPSLPGGVTRVSGYVTASEIDFLSLFMRKAPPNLTLHLEEGLRWDCRLASVEGRLHPVGVRLYRVVNGQREDVF